MDDRNLSDENVLNAAAFRRIANAVPDAGGRLGEIVQRADNALLESSDDEDEDDEDDEAPTQRASQASQSYFHFAQPSQQPKDSHVVRQHIQPLPPTQPPTQGNQRSQPAPVPRRMRGVGHTKDEVEHMLDCVEEVMPLGAQMWEDVAMRHARRCDDRNRDGKKLKKKFQDLYKTSAPTGDPHVPPNVLRAKRLQREIMASSSAADPSEEAGGYGTGRS